MVGSAGEIHSLDPWVACTGRQVWLCECLRPAVVLGSTQPEHHLDVDRLRAAGVELARRRSGGGAVLVVPDETVWVAVAVPSADPLWVADVGEAFVWLGRAWAHALNSLRSPGSRSGSPDDGIATVHQGSLRRTAWSAHACFAGLGPGEVSVDGRKVVGISQRRTREGAVFHCAAHLGTSGTDLAELLALREGDRDEVFAALSCGSGSLSGAVGRLLDRAEVDQALLSHPAFGL
ncbi:MAG: lipoate--protein ligase family protein [Acidimicrobiales bacterium]